MQAVFRFLGVNPEIVLAHPTTFEGPEMKAKTVQEAEGEIRAIVNRWSFSLDHGPT